MAKDVIRKFEANTDKILKLVTHNIYQDKDTAIRELISNAADACNKLPSSFNGEDRKILIKIKEKELHIIDNGIGLTQDEMIKNLGCIAHSDTEQFIQNDKNKKTNMIGNFGIGFYSAFLISESVQFYSKSSKEKDSKWFLWKSNGEKEYTIKEETPKEYKDKSYGSVIILTIKDENFLKPFNIKNVIKKYSDHIDTQIYLANKDQVEELVNEGKAIWLKSKNEIPEEEYLSFLKNKFHYSDKPLSIIHNNLEGSFEYINLFYIPLNKSLGFMSNKMKSDVHLYINQVLISSESVEILPKFLRFVYGVVHCSSLNLNISRDNIQNNTTLKKVQNISMKKVLENLTYEIKENREKYETFFKNYGDIIKEGLCDPASYNYDESLKEMILRSCLFFSAKEKKFISLEEFNQDQKDILYINAKSVQEGLSNTKVEKKITEGEDVLILTSHVDNFWSGNGFVFNKKSFVSIYHISKDEKDKKIEKSKDSTLCKKFKDILKDEVKDVFISETNANSPLSIILNTPNNMSRQMEQYLIQQSHLTEKAQPSLEIHINNAIIKKIEKNIDSNNINSIIKVLFYQAQINSGEELNNEKDFRDNINNLVTQLLPS